MNFIHIYCPLLVTDTIERVYRNHKQIMFDLSLDTENNSISISIRILEYN